MTKGFRAASRSSTDRRDLHAELTAKIIAQIEQGAGEFKMPWHRPGIAFTIPKNALTEARYRGSNILWLWMAADEKKFEHQVFATYRQWQQLGAQVRVGEKGSMIVKVGEWIPNARNGNDTASDHAKPSGPGDEEEGAKRLYAKPAFVFNIDQVDVPAELRARLLPPTAPRPDLTVRLTHVDAFIANTGAEFREGGQRAFYRHRASDGSGDFIQMPERNLFTGTETSTPTEAYEGTRLHELSHHSHAPNRMGLEPPARFGGERYAFQELACDLFAAFMCAELEITNVPRTDHAQYVSSWLSVLKNDPKAIFTAASIATRTVDYVMALQPKPDRTPSTDAAVLDAGGDGPNSSPTGAQ